ERLLLRESLLATFEVAPNWFAQQDQDEDPDDRDAAAGDEEGQPPVRMIGVRRRVVDEQTDTEGRREERDPPDRPLHRECSAASIDRVVVGEQREEGDGRRRVADA